jgi:hypothetical protein
MRRRDAEKNQPKPKEERRSENRCAKPIAILVESPAI